jgi:predicted O-methyltransferase YrrM
MATISRNVYYARRRLIHGLLRRSEKLARNLWVADPLAPSPRATREKYLEVHATAQQYDYPLVDALERELGFALDRDFMNKLALHTQVVIKSSPMMWAHGRILYAVLSDYLKAFPAASPSERITILETGTARGYSAICMAKALHDASRPGVIFTTDILPHDRAIYWNCIDDLESRKTRRALLEPWRDLVDDYIVFFWGDSQLTLNTLAMSRINFAFLDGGHTYEDVMVEFSKVGPCQKSGDIIVFDDVTPASFPGIAKAVAEICATHGYTRRDIQTHETRIHAICRKR